MKNYETKPCSHCGKHSRIETEYCPWCWRPYNPRVVWWEALKLTAVVAIVCVVIARVFWS